MDSMISSGFEEISKVHDQNFEIVEQGVNFRCDLQKLNVQARKDGLWISSSTDEGNGTFRIKAASLGREHHIGIRLPDEGGVSTECGKVRFNRSSVVEEYSVSAEGVRQDFIVNQRPAGNGAMILDLDLSGANAESSPDGIMLTLDRCGRRIAYHKLRVSDSTGRVLPAGFRVRSDGISVMVDDTAAVYPVTVDPTFSDADWISSMGPGGWADKAVYAAAVDAAGNLYVGGSFTKVGDLAASGVAKWDGCKWSALGGGIIGGNVNVRALCCIGNDVYVGGMFTNAGGVLVNNVARWDGSSWHPLGSGTNNGILSLKEWRGELYAGGGFTSAGGTPANYIARWNGSSWSALGAGVNWTRAAAPYAWVSCLEDAGDRLYVGGTFTSAGGLDAYGLAQWNGTEWSAVGGFRAMTLRFGKVPEAWEADIPVSALARDGGILYAAAGWQVFKWNGSAWSALGGAVGGDPLKEYKIHDMLVIDGKVHICGFFYTAGGTVANSAARWNGTGWEGLASGFDMWPVGDPAVYCMAASGGKLYVGGLFLWAGGALSVNLAHWSGEKWSPIGQGLAGNVHAVVEEAGKVYVAGDFKGADGTEVNHVASRAAGASKWQPLGGGTNGPVNALVWWNGELYAGGEFTSAGGLAASNIAKWTGTSWMSVGSGFDGPVDALAVWNGELYSGGAFSRSGTALVSGIAKWNGAAWQPVGTGTTGAVSSMASAGGDLYVGGYFDQAGGVPANLVARWNGHQWSPLGDGIGSSSWFPFVSALAVSTRGEVYAGGFFGNAGEVAVTNVAKWNGSSWSAMGSGLTGPVNTLSVCGNLVYSGGGFEDSGGRPVSHIACWDGSSWGGLGAGVDRSVSSLFVSGNSLYVGGSFTIAGDKYANSIAAITIPVPPSVSSALNATARVGTSFSYQITADNNPTLYSAQLTPALPSPGPGMPGGGLNLPAGLSFNPVLGLVSGTPTTAGTYQLLLGASNSAGTGTAILTLVVDASSPVVSWAQAAGLTGSNAEPTATPFNDGVPNLLKFAFNMNAGSPDSSVLGEGGSSGLPNIQVDDSGSLPVLRVQFLRRRNSGLVYVPERATSLDSFAPMNGIQTVTPIDDTWERVEVVETAPSAPATRSEFARVRVTIP